MDGNKRRRRLAAGILFFIYFIVLFYFLFFSEELGRTYSERTYHYNLVPFKEIGRFIRYRERLGMKAVLLNIFGNVAAFVPFGVYLPVYFRRCQRFLWAVFFSFELSLAVELLQLVFKVGSFDVDDLLLNTLGGMLGFLVFVCWKRMVRTWERQPDGGGSSGEGKKEL